MKSKLLCPSPWSHHTRPFLVYSQMTFLRLPPKAPSHKFSYFEHTSVIFDSAGEKFPMGQDGLSKELAGGWGGSSASSPSPAATGCPAPTSLPVPWPFHLQGQQWPSSLPHMHLTLTGLPWWLSGKESAWNTGDIGDPVRFLGWADALEKGMATHSSILAWEIPWTEEPGGLEPMGSQRVGRDWAHTHTHSASLFHY